MTIWTIVIESLFTKEVNVKPRLVQLNRARKPKR